MVGINATFDLSHVDVFSYLIAKERTHRMPPTGSEALDQPTTPATDESKHAVHQPRISVLMVSYNTKALTLKALETLYASTPASLFETILVDNASQDGSADAIAEAFPMVELIRSDENLGFGKANNLAAERARGEWILLLNPDTETFHGSIERLLAFGEAHPEGGIYGGRTVFPDGSLNIASCWNRPTPWSVLCRALGLSTVFAGSSLFNPEQIGSWQRDSVRHVDIVFGCFLLIRKSLWDQLKGFDTDFWLYGEDTDLCLRARRLGYRPMFTPDAVIMHLIGASSRNRADREALLYKACRMVIERHWSPAMRPIGIGFLSLGAWTRMMASALLAVLSPQRFKATASYWKEVWEQRSLWEQV